MRITTLINGHADELVVIENEVTVLLLRYALRPLICEAMLQGMTNIIQNLFSF